MNRLNLALRPDERIHILQAVSGAVTEMPAGENLRLTIALRSEPPLHPLRESTDGNL